ncbi:MAG: hypothetical protein WCW64_11305, partial [Phycisphaerae bacterium]
APADGVKPNDRLTYTIYYRYPDTNPNYTTSLTNIIITDSLPAEVDFFSASTGYSYNPSTRTVTWTRSTLSPGNSGLTRGLEGLPDGLGSLIFDVSHLPRGLAHLSDDVSCLQRGLARLPDDVSHLQRGLGLASLTDDVSCLPEGLSKLDMRLSISIMRT